jgi:uncharacterized YigZ family protein
VAIQQIYLMSEAYLVPSAICRTETIVLNSRFITTIAPVVSTDEAKTSLTNIRAEMPDASHHPYAFRLGFGNSVVEGMSDAGEPPGTAGAPVLSVLRGTEIGDILIVVTRYFGGTKLGTGGLVRAYTDAAKTGLAALNTEIRTQKCVVGLEMPYHFYEIIRHLIAQYNGLVEDEIFETSVTMVVSFPVNLLPEFSHRLAEKTAGKIETVILSTSH